MKQTWTLIYELSGAPTGNCIPTVGLVSKEGLAWGIQGGIKWKEGGSVTKEHLFLHQITMIRLLLEGPRGTNTTEYADKVIT